MKIALFLIVGSLSALAAVPVVIDANVQGQAFSVSGMGCSGGQYLTPQTLQWTPGSSCTVTFVSPHSTQSGIRYLFSGWQDGNASNPRTIAAPSQATTYATSFTTQYLLTLAANPPEGGTVSGGDWVNPGTPVTITETPSPGYRFVGWTSTSNAPQGTSPATVTLNQPTVVTATFAPITNALPFNYTVLPVVSQGNTNGPHPLNSLGQITGFSNSFQVSPFLWIPATTNGSIGSLKDLGPVPVPSSFNGALGINDFGQIAGVLQSFNNGFISNKVILWTPSGSSGSYQVITDGSPGALNNFGQVGGSGFLWTPASANATTGTLTSGSQFNGLLALNGFGQALLQNSPLPTLFTPLSPHGSTGTFTSIPGLAGAGQNFLVAINEAGTILGYSCFATSSGQCQNHAFLWKPTSANGVSGTTTEVLLPNGFVSLTPSALNDNGDIVGSIVLTDGTAIPFLFTNNTIYDLTTASGLLIGASPTGINNFGQIVLNGNGVVYLATPMPTNPPPPPNAVPVVIDANVQGQAFSVSGAGCSGGQYLTPQTLQWTPGSSCTVTFVSPHSTQSGIRYLFSGWQDGNASNPRTIAAPSQATTYATSFTTQYLLTLAANPPEGGTVSGGDWVNPGTPVTITETPSPGYRFVGWTSTSNAPQGTSPATVTLNQPTVVTATFAPITNALPFNYTVLPVVSQGNTNGPHPLNSLGQITGFSNSFQVSPFLWIPATTNGSIGSLKDLGPVPVPSSFNGALGINDFGQIAGVLQSFNNGFISNKVILWTPSGNSGSYQVITDGSPGALNNFGQVGGSGFLWTPASANATTGTLTSGSQFNGLLALNGFGQALLQNSPLPTLFTPLSPHGSTGTFTSIPGLAGAGQNFLVAINEAGTILGYSCFTTPSGQCQNHAFLWKPTSTNGVSGTTTEILLPNGFVSMTPTALNDNGDIVGSIVLTDGTAIPFLFTNNTIYDLTTASGLLIGASPTGINNFGQIVFNGNSVVYIATPTISISAPVSVTINSTPTGIGFQADGTATTTPATFQWVPGSIHNVSVPTALAGTTTQRVTFTTWSDGQKNPTRQITTPQADAGYVASYTTQFKLDFSSNPAVGGLLLASPTSTDGFYNSGTSVKVTAIPNAAYQFTGFSGALSGAANGQSVTMDAPKAVSGNFSLVQNPTLAVTLRNDVSAAAQPGPDVIAVLQVANTGPGIARSVQITSLDIRVLAPAPAQLQANKTLPITIGDLNAGVSSANIQIPFAIPATTRRLVILVGGTFANSAGQIFSFSNSLTILR